jgi:hypothetical protein
MVGGRASSGQAPELGNVPHQQVRTAVQQIDREEADATRNAVAAAVGHAEKMADR